MGGRGSKWRKQPKPGIRKANKTRLPALPLPSISVPRAPRRAARGTQPRGPHPEDEVEAEEKVLDALRASFDGHGGGYRHSNQAPELRRRSLNAALPGYLGDSPARPRGRPRPRPAPAAALLRPRPGGLPALQQRLTGPGAAVLGARSVPAWRGSTRNVRILLSALHGAASAIPPCA